MKNNKKKAEKTPKAEKTEITSEMPMKRISTLGIMPVGDRILLKLADNNDAEKSNKFGIIIPETIDKEKPEQGKVVAVGEGRRDEAGKLIPMSVKIGDTVIFSKYSYDEVKHAGEEYIMVKEENVLAIIK